jgi:hypothetical protein
MSKQAKSAPFGRSGLEWSYGSERFERNRQVTVFPYEMLGDILSLSAEAKGVLLTLFCRYWPEDKAQVADFLRREHGMSARRFARVVEELVGSGVVTRVGNRIAPARSFGPGAAPVVRRASTREMPSDWLDKREVVFARDGYACVYCGSGGLELHCDHVEPVSRGGGHEIENLVTACSICNLSKGAKTLAEWRPELAEAFKR